ncbi:DoxX family protein [Novosphingobium sp. fls2-241-R2A-195]|uniref:DoxX family protein n=1 Tax=Novosphingobium sp. fls2-241-R2A-195 TaxID=3040296 RepID=UPI00254F4573|nr:DoxX family protein [Novosphingobium sp. fls2-241-R2A-195]
MRVRRYSCAMLAMLYALAGALHLIIPAPFVAIVPDWVPAPASVVMLTGLAEIAGAAGIGQSWAPRLRIAAGCGLSAYALCVWPANVQHMLLDLAKPEHGLGLAYHLPRLAFQPVLIWWPLWAANVTAWPFRQQT